ncbi:thaumatin family protein [Actinacidiphila paucisporea]|uniref:thaumatin family protein n=1 Tax=Actinacidiphila paucisporea TaxID=310782 RepID=UPI0009372463|nr:thaumatin family protein [Actinacidiphila paucisporea]
MAACLAVLAGYLVSAGRGGDASDRGVAAADADVTPGTVTASGSPGAQAATTSSVSASARPSKSPSPSARAAKPSAASPSASAGAKQPAAPASTHAAGKRTVTLVNRLGQTIWPAIAADPDHPIQATGWVLAPGASLSFTVPDHWDVRVWARTGCSFDSAGNGHCVTGDCGHFQCGRTWGEFPSTLAEFNLNAWNGMDFYDVSLVEGNNLPMWINSSGGSSKDKMNSRGCTAAGCTHDANVGCPKALQRVRGGKVVACLSACLVYKTDSTCCTGSYAPRSKCVPSSWPVDSAAVFKKAEPFAYSYVNDDATSVLTCAGECDYRITWGVSP